jgi:tetratricopeptide (TPR) repeat protein
MSPLRLAVAVWLSLAAVGCAKRIPVSYERPPPVLVDRAAPVAVAADSPEGRSAGQNVLEVMGSIGQGLKLNRWAAIPVVEREFAEAWRRAGYTATGAVESAVLWLKLEPTGWHEESSSDSKKKHSGVAVLAVTATFIDPKAPQAQGPVFTRSYKAQGQLSHGESRAMEEAAANAAAQFLADLEPKRVSARLNIDTSDPLAEPGFQLVQSDRFDDALANFTEASASAPQNPTLLYNRGVLLVWKGQLEEGAALIDEALKYKPNDGEFNQARQYVSGALEAKRIWASRGQAAR